MLFDLSVCLDSIITISKILLSKIVSGNYYEIFMHTNYKIQFNNVQFFVNQRKGDRFLIR